MTNNADEPLNESDARDLFQVLLGHVADRELGTEIDAQTALRKALLILIVMVQPDSSELLRRYFRYLLYEFQPLSSHFDEDDLHALVLNESVVRCKSDVDRGAKLLTSQELMDKLLKELT